VAVDGSVIRPPISIQSRKGRPRGEYRELRRRISIIRF